MVFNQLAATLCIYQGSRRVFCSRVREAENFIEGNRLQVSETYKLRFFHGVDHNNQPQYTYKRLTDDQSTEIYQCLELRKLLYKIETAYEFVVNNYRDYELYNFSTSLNYLLEINEDKYEVISARNGVDRHISNILTSTYIYTCILKADKKDTETISTLKRHFQVMANQRHETHYQYTLLSALRNKINHGGSLEKLTELGTAWSTKRGATNKEDNFIPRRKDKRHFYFDLVVHKNEAKRIIKNEHFLAIESSMPDEFYFRDAVRVYIDHLSTMHSKFRIKSDPEVERADNLLTSYLVEAGNFVQASLIKLDAETVLEAIEIPNVSSAEMTGRTVSKAPLYLEHLPMPGEDSAVQHFE